MFHVTNSGLRLIKVKKTYDEEPPRMKWSSRRDYLCASIGLIVGLGNAWRFPILLSRNGGSAFLIPYTLATVCLAIPITYVELALGQFSQRGPTGIWILCPLAKGVGWAIVLYSVYVCSYYNVILSYCTYYFFSSLTFDLPWKSCKGSWVKENCYTRKESSAILRSCAAKHGKDHCNNMTWELATEHFWRRRVLDIASTDLTSGLGGLKWDLILCLFLMCFIISLVSCMGLRSIEKVAPFTTAYPYISLFVLLFVTLIHEGSGIGVSFLFYPDFSKLADVDIWRLAVEQVFYSVGIASGSLIAFGSYCPFRNPVHMDAVTLNLVDYGTSLIFGVVLYNCLGAISYDLSIDIQDVAANKTLTFVLIPEALLHLPGPSMLWSLVFYSMVICVGLSTEYCLVAANLGVIYDLYPLTLKYKLYMSAGAGLVIFTLGLPLVTRNGSLLLNMIDNYCGGPIVMSVAVVEALVLFWIYGVKKITDDIHFMLGFRPTTYWRACWLLGPAYLGTIFVLGIYYESNNTTFSVLLQVIGWILFTIPLVVTACFGIYNVIKYRRMNRTLHIFKPEPTWGPMDPILMKSRRMFSSQTMTKEYMYRQARLQARDRIRRQNVQ